MAVNYEQWQQQFKMKMMQAPLHELEHDIRDMERQLREHEQFADLSSLYYNEVNVYFMHSSAYKALKKIIEYRPYFDQYASRIERMRIQLGTYTLLEVAGYDETYFDETYALLKEMKELGIPALEVSALNNLGTYLLKNRRYEESIGYFLEAARIYEAYPNEAYGPLAYYLALNIISNSYALNNKQQAEKWLDFAKQQGAHDPFISIFLTVITMTWELDHGDANKALEHARELLAVDVTQYDNRIMMMLNNMLDVFRHHEAADEEVIVLEQLIALTKAANSEQIKQQLVECQYGMSEMIAYENLYEDALTGVWNRQGFEKTVAPLVSKQHEKWKLLAIVDVDYFKPINDTYGHAIGDAALQQICRRVERVMSRYVNEASALYFGRYGGDEFLLYYEASDEAALQTLIAAVHAEVTGTPFVQRQTTFPLSISVGVVATQQPMMYEALLQLADDTLYEMKRNEKGQFTITWR